MVAVAVAVVVAVAIAACCSFCCSLHFGLDGASFALVFLAVAVAGFCFFPVDCLWCLSGVCRWLPVVVCCFLLVLDGGCCLRMFLVV